MRERKGCLERSVFNFQICYTCLGPSIPGQVNVNIRNTLSSLSFSKLMYVEDIEVEEITLKR